MPLKIENVGTFRLLVCYVLLPFLVILELPSFVAISQVGVEYAWALSPLVFIVFGVGYGADTAFLSARNTGGRRLPLLRLQVFALMLGYGLGFHLMIRSVGWVAEAIPTVLFYILVMAVLYGLALLFGGWLAHRICPKLHDQGLHLVAPNDNRPFKGGIDD